MNNLINTYFSRIFYINLKKDLERNVNILKQFDSYNITNYERVEGYVLKENLSLESYRNFIKSDEKYIRGGVACRKAHVECVKIAKERSYSSILILEDDISFLKDPNLVLQQNITTLGQWDMLYFGGLIEPQFRNQIVGAYAYAIKAKLYDDIILMAESSGMEIDNFYAKIVQHMSYNYNSSGKYDIKIVQPFNSISHPSIFNSNIQK